jgi:D-inositol-3-phosphate glycosyltransferase
MHIALVSEHASPLAALGGADAGGQNVHVAALATALARRSHSVVVYTRRDDPTLERRVHTFPGVIVDHVDAGPPVHVAKDDLRPWMGQFADQLQDRWQRDRPDVVHAHFWMSGLAALEAARPIKVPVVQTFHALGSVKRRFQGPSDTSPRDRLEVERHLLAEVDHVVATCADEVDELGRLGPSPRNLSVIPCGVDLQLFRPLGPVQSRPPLPKHRLLVIGRLVERKGIADVIEALQWLPDTELLIAGGPPADGLDADENVRRLRRQVGRFGLDGRVRFLGRVGRSELPALLRSADAVVSVPYYEPFGIVPLEAMACGIPVVVSAVGGLTQSVVHGETGLHVPAGAPRALSEALARLLQDPEAARRLGRAGAVRAQMYYGWDEVAARTAGVYEQLAPGAADRRRDDPPSEWRDSLVVG